MKKFTFIIGGARSGKSSYAVDLAEGSGRKVAFIATAVPLDEEMNKRIKAHKSARPKYWDTIEESKNITSVITRLGNNYGAAVIDCMGMLISNLLSSDLSDKEIMEELNILVSAVLKSKVPIILVSNEVGMGIVPDNSLARRFRDLLGTANQMAAKSADEVIFMQAGIPVKIKEGKNEALKRNSERN